MKQYWLRISQKIDALTLRERCIVFALAVVVLITLVNAVLLDPQTAKQQKLSRQLKENQAKMTEMQTEMERKAKVESIDPDATNRSRLQALNQQAAQMHAALAQMQKGIVSPDKMSELLESILKQHGRLHLVSLRTLKAAGLTEGMTEAKTALPENGLPGAPVTPPSVKGTASPKPEAVYKHGVELVIQGSYADLTNYLTALEKLPWQLYWSNVRLKVDEYPKATLVLTVFTLSLDRKWLNT